MATEPKYIGPYSAETYDKMYGTGVLFTMPTFNMPILPSDTSAPQPERKGLDRLDSTGWGRMDLMVFVGVAILIFILIMVLLKRI